MPQLPQAHFCKTCGETDPSKFVGRLKGRCYECYKKECRRRYAEGVRLINPLLCKICGTTDPCNFFPNGGTKCKRCLHPNKKIKTYQDHRMAMAFAPLALKTPIEIQNAEVVSKSYPSFWNDLRNIGFQISEQKAL